jgi:hypothetical protein
MAAYAEAATVPRFGVTVSIRVLLPIAKKIPDPEGADPTILFPEDILKNGAAIDEEPARIPVG